MKIFDLQEPISLAIKNKVETLVDPTIPNTSKRIKFLDYEPTQNEILAYPDFKNDSGYNLDGVIAVYASNLSGTNSSSQTGEQETDNRITIDCYSFGDVFTDGGSESKSIESAQKRAQLLVTLSYKGLMDQTELGESFGTGINIAEKVFTNTEKVASIGSEVSCRAISFYRSIFNLKLGEDVPSEVLGPAYVGGSAEQETTNP
ncbi:MAG: hypothetical protein ACTSRG_13095 [Candidatus Helarchaeota archaeon]